MQHANLTIEYHFVRDSVASEHWAASHVQVLALLEQSVKAGLITQFHNRERTAALPGNDYDRALLNTCRDFAMSRHVRLRLGSNKYPYGWFPPQLLILRSAQQIAAVIPCEIEGFVIEPEQFLDAFLRREPWTIVSARRRTGGGPHKKLIEAIVADPTCLEAGLSLHAENVWVADASGEVGYIDLLLIDTRGRYVLVEVKVQGKEIDTGIGQILKQGIMFARQNFLDEARVRLALACPDIPDVRRLACAKAGIECFKLPTAAGKEAPLR